MRLQILQTPPAGLFDTPAEALAAKLGGPTLLHLAGQPAATGKPALFVSVLLHGNELSGWHALCELCRDGHPPARSMMIFIGNVSAAQAGLRTLPGQADYNRIWRGHPGAERVWVDELLAYVAQHKPFAALDLHNNTGRNPHYCVMTGLDSASRGLARLFSDKAVFIEEPATVLSRALQRVCPAVAVELGPINDPASDVRALALLQACLELERVPSDSQAGLDLHKAVARLHVLDGVTFDFVGEEGDQTDSNADLQLTGGIEAVNFHQLISGFELGRTRKPLDEVLLVLDPEHRVVTADYLAVVGERVLLRQPVIPAMFTTDRQVVRQDCLCYFMQKLPPG